MCGTISEFDQITRDIYRIRKSGEHYILIDYFIDTLEIPKKDAEKMARCYNPSKPPTELCPAKVVELNWNSSKIFDELSVQLQDIWPKNILAWYILRHIFGHELFSFTIHSESTKEQGQNYIRFSALPVDKKGNHVRFGLAAIDATVRGDMPAVILNKAKPLISSLGDIGLEITKSLMEADFIFPQSIVLEKLAKVMKRGLEGEEIILTGTLCPDYAYEETGRPELPYSYTFTSVSDGIGLVALQIQRVIPYMVELFSRIGIRYRIVFGMCDFEADSNEILMRVGTSKEEFINRCEHSLDAFQEALSEIPMELIMFERDWAGKRWKIYIEEAYAMMKADDFGLIKSNTGNDPMEDVVRSIARSSNNFYNQWYGRKLSDDELVDIVLRQGAEYAVMGRIIGEDFEGLPIIQIAGDRPKMQTFNSMYSNHPTLCTRRVY